MNLENYKIVIVIFTNTFFSLKNEKKLYYLLIMQI